MAFSEPSEGEGKGNKKTIEQQRSSLKDVPDVNNTPYYATCEFDFLSCR